MSSILTTLYSECQGYLELRALKSGVKDKPREFFNLTDMNGIKGFIATYKSYEIYFAISTRDGKGGKKENIVNIPCLWGDIDFKDIPEQEARARIAAFPFKPTIIVKSGGGLHLYWKLKEPCGPEDIDRIEAILRGIAVKLGADMAATDASRILRVPHTLNHKYRPPRPVVLEHCNGSEFSLDDFDDFVVESPSAKNIEVTYNEINNDRLQKIMACRFMQHCQANASKLSEIEWYCMITQLAKEPGGISLIHKLSRPYPKYKKSETDEKILHALNATGPMSCDVIHEKTGFECDASCLSKAPASLAFSLGESDYEKGGNGGQKETTETKGDNDVFGDTRGTVGGQIGDSGGQIGDNEGDNRGDNEETNSKPLSTQGIAALVETYITNFVGNFSTRDLTEYIQSSMGIPQLPRLHQKALAKVLSRHVKDLRLERTARGGYRIIDCTLDDLDEGLGASEHHIKLPLGLNKLVYVEPKEVILVCGNSDGGKTCFALQVGLLNKTHIYNSGDKNDLNTLRGAGGFLTYHFVSEMGGVSFRNKLSHVGADAYDDYRKHVRVLRFKASSIADQIQPNSINIIDYLEPPEGDFRLIVPAINAIFEKLDKGVAVVCIQMRTEAPVGGMGVFWRPRLAVGLLNDPERSCKVAKIFKGKNIRGDKGIDQWEMDYWVENRGTSFTSLTDWEQPFGRVRKRYIKV